MMSENSLHPIKWSVKWLLYSTCLFYLLSFHLLWVVLDEMDYEFWPAERDHNYPLFSEQNKADFNLSLKNDISIGRIKY